MRLRIAAIAGCAALVLGAGAPGAGAHKKTFKSVIAIDMYTVTGQWGGTVGSFDNKRCGRHRVVALWKINPGAMDGPMGTTRTDATGRWTLNAAAANSSYYATVKKRFLRKSRKHRHLCRFARSDPFEIGF